MVESIWRMMKGIMSPEIRKALCDGIMVLTLSFASEMWTRNEERFMIQRMEINSLRSVYCVN